RILYIFAGSYVRLMRNIIEKSDSPFFAQIKPYYVNNFDKEDSRLYLGKLCKQISLELPAEVEKSIIQSTAGHPFYLELLTHALEEAQRREDLELTPGNTQKVLLLQLVNEKSPLHLHLRYIYEDALGHARGSAILQGILKVLAQDESLTVTEIAKRLSRKPAAIQIGLSELIKVDLLARKNKVYHISDPLLRWWIYFKFYHPEGAFSLQDKIIQELSDDFRERYLQATMELGRAKEFELYYFVTKMQGQKIGSATLPAFKTLIKNYLLPNGDEIDLFARNKESWVFELKWKNKLIGMNELQKLKKKIQVDRYVLISKKGFTKALTDHAQNSSDIILWDAEMLMQAQSVLPPS
ncbi:MAG: restriction endonuclease, partial [bacterium]